MKKRTRRQTSNKRGIRYQRQPKNDLVVALLEILKESSLFTLDIVDLMLSGHRWIYSGTRQKLNDISVRREKILTNKFERLKERRRLQNLLYQLQKKGYIFKHHVDKKNKWSITTRGLQKLASSESILSKSIFYLPEKKFQSQPDNVLKVIIFDIPEKHRVARNWLREKLVEMDFKLLQQSVWIGKKKLPLEFMVSLKELKLIPHCVKIFAVNDEGSIYS